MEKKIMHVLSGIIFGGTGFFLGGKILVNMINDYKMRMERNQSNMMIFNDWLKYIYSGGKVEQYFQNHGYGSIMIYGNGYIGIRLKQALLETDIRIVAVMDKTVSSGENDMVIGIDSKIPNVDCIVVTPVFYYKEIHSMLQKRTKIPIVSVSEIWEENI